MKTKRKQKQPVLKPILPNLPKGPGILILDEITVPNPELSKVIADAIQPRSQLGQMVADELDPTIPGKPDVEWIVQLADYYEEECKDHHELTEAVRRTLGMFNQLNGCPLIPATMVAGVLKRLQEAYDKHGF